MPERVTSELAVVSLSWSPLPENQWNGIPLGYFVYVLRHADRQQVVHEVHYPETSLVVGVVPGLYDIHIDAVNNVGNSEETLQVSGLAFGEESSSDTFADYPYFYILIPGVIFLVVIVVIIIVIFKKVHENKKRSITFVRGERDCGSSGDLGNAVEIPKCGLPETRASCLDGALGFVKCVLFHP